MHTHSHSAHSVRAHWQEMRRSIFRNKSLDCHISTHAVAIRSTRAQARKKKRTCKIVPSEWFPEDDRQLLTGWLYRIGRTDAPPRTNYVAHANRTAARKSIANKSAPRRVCVCTVYASFRKRMKCLRDSFSLLFNIRWAGNKMIIIYNL